MKKVLLWTVVFAVFGMYSGAVLTSAYEGASVAEAYAKTIEENNNKGKGKGHGIYVVASTPNVNPFERILERLQLRADRERELCEVSEEQLAELSQSNEFEMEDLDVSGKPIKIAKPKKYLSSKELKRRDIHCMKLSIYERLILHFSGHVS